jgi:mannose-1-phosphate guanylyltransferase
MAGGTGKRLWPLSRKSRPKQVLQLLEGQTLLRKCYERLEGIFDNENIIVLTNANYVETVRENLRELPAENVVAEPAVRDTASAIGLAATILHKRDANANMAIVTADQILEPKDKFKEVMTTALSFVNENPEALLTFGIQPTFPSTQFGYIKFGKEASNGVCAIDAFAEKPDEETAKKYLAEGNYSWNAGLFVWRCETILNNLKKFVPDGTEPLEKIRQAWGTPDQQKALEEWFPKHPKISIDYAVMENAENVYGIELNCNWFDLGSFTALRDIVKADANDNTIVSDHSQILDSKSNIVVTEEKGHLFALIGVDNLIVAHTKDATLVCAMDQVVRLKELLGHIEEAGNESFL